MRIESGTPAGVDQKVAVVRSPGAVNTVGKMLRKPMLETTEAGYDSMFDINAKSAYFFPSVTFAHCYRRVAVLTRTLAGRKGTEPTYSGMFLWRPRRAGASASAWVILLRVCEGSIFSSTTPMSMAESTPPAIRSCSKASSSCRASRS